MQAEGSYSRHHMIAVSVGVLPKAGALEGLTPFTEAAGGGEVEGEVETSGARLARQTASLMALLGTRDSMGATEKTSKVWLGEGLGRGRMTEP